MVDFRIIDRYNISKLKTQKDVDKLKVFGNEGGVLMSVATKVVKTFYKLCLLFGLVMAVNGGMAEVNATQYEEWIYEENENGEIILTGYSGTDAEVTVPQIIDGKTVIALRGTFDKNQRIKKVVLPESVNEIGFHTFFGCVNLESVNLDDVITIGESAFYMFAYDEEGNKIPSKLEFIGDTGNVTKIGWNAFCDCVLLKHLNLEKVTQISGRAFWGCENLFSVTGTENITYIGEGAFYDCKSLVEFDLQNITVVEEDVFSGCHSLSNVGNTTNITEIKAGAFKGCISLKSIDLKNVEIVGNHAFDMAVFANGVTLKSSLTEVKNTDKIVSLGDFAFFVCRFESIDLPNVRYIGCDALSSATLKHIRFDKVQVIKDNAFEGCSKLEKIIMPKTITEMGNTVFMACEDNVILYVAPNSYAHKYAVKYNISYVFDIHIGTINNQKYIVDRYGDVADLSGLVQVGSDYYYALHGRVLNVDKFIKYGNDYWYVKNGKVYKETTLVKHNGRHHYIKNGKWCKDEALVKCNGAYWYVSGGYLCSKTALIKYENTYWYIRNGKFTPITTLMKYGNGYWYIKNGKLSKESTLVKYNGKYWYVESGKMKRLTTLVKYKHQYWYVKDGVFKNATTLAKYKNKYYFVQKGKVNFNYSGTFVYNGVRWRIVKGIVVGRA